MDESTASPADMTHASISPEVTAAVTAEISKMNDMYRTLMSQVKKLGKNKMADTVMIPQGGDGLFGAGSGGMIGGLILGSLLRNNGNLFGGDGAGAAAGAVLRSPPEQVQANMSIMQSLGAIDKSVAVASAAAENSNSQQTNMLSGQLSQVAAATVNQITGVKEAVNAGTMVLAQQLNGVNTNLLQAQNNITSAISNDGEKTRALITAQYEATLNRQLSDANAQIIELRGDQRLAAASRGIEINTTNNIAQAQAQQQQQQQFQTLGGLIANLANDLQYIRATNQAINIGAGTQTANPTNTNTNVRA